MSVLRDVASTGPDDDSGGSGTGILVAAGLLFTAVTLWGLIQDVRRMIAWPSATATVVGHQVIGSNGERAPVVEYRTSSGLAVRSSDRTFVRGRSYSVGKTIRVHYNAADPQQVLIGYRRIVFITLVMLWVAGWTVFFSTR